MTEQLRAYAHKILRRLAAEFEPRLGSGVAVCDFAGVKIALDLSERTHRTIARRREFEPQVTAALRGVLRPGDVMIDVGANMGWHSVHVLMSRPDIRSSHAFEPGRVAFTLLERSIVANGLQTRCHAQRVAVGAEAGTLSLKVFPSLGTVRSSAFPLADWPYVEELVDVAPLDRLVLDAGVHPAVIKCDVEGGELDVLRGARNLLGGANGDPPFWFLEVNYETSGMAGYFPWELIEEAASKARYRGFTIRDGKFLEVRSKTAMRHGDTLVLAIPEVHGGRLRSMIA